VRLLRRQRKNPKRAIARTPSTAPITIPAITPPEMLLEPESDDEDDEDEVDSVATSSGESVVVTETCVDSETGLILISYRV
jgi:hypothetical protein